MPPACMLPPGSAGLGLRRALLGPLQDAAPGGVDFLEVAPENWIGVGGRLGRQFEALAERYPLACHGLSLSLGGVRPLDESFLRRVRGFLDRHQVSLYSEHLSYCTDEGHLYDLMPIPFTAEAVEHVSAQIRHAQDLLGRQMIVENVSYYAAPHREMDEIEFVNAVLERSGCALLLDVNNVHVNSINHGYDTHDYLRRLPAGRVAYLHVAGHYEEAPDLIVDTHGAPVVAPVWELLDEAYRLFGPLPTLLERDFNFPPIATLLEEIETIRALQRGHASASARHAASA